MKIHINEETFLRSFKKDINNEPTKIIDILNYIASETSVNIDNVDVIFHGIVLPLNTPLIFLTTFCSYIDGIVQLVLRSQ